MQIQPLASTTSAPLGLPTGPVARLEQGPRSLDLTGRVLCHCLCLELGQHWSAVSEWVEGWTARTRSQRDDQHESLERYTGFARQTIDQVRGLEGGVVARKQAERSRCQEVLNRFHRSAAPEHLGKELVPLRQAIQSYHQRNTELQRLDTFQRESVAYYRIQAERVRDRFVAIAVVTAAIQNEALGRLALLIPQQAGGLAREAGLRVEQVSALRTELTAMVEPVDWDVEAEPLAPEHVALGGREVAQAEGICSQGKERLQEGVLCQPDSRDLWASLASASSG